MPFGLCNAPATFQRCILSIFSDMVGDILKIFMDDLSLFRSTFDNCLTILHVSWSAARKRTCCSTGRSAISWCRRGSSSDTSYRRTESKWTKPRLISFPFFLLLETSRAFGHSLATQVFIDNSYRISVRLLGL